MGAGTLEVLSAGSEPSRRRRSVLLVAGVLVALLAGAAWAADLHRQRGESRRLRACVSTLDDASTRERARVSWMAAYVSPALREGTPPATVDGLHAMVAGEAGRAAAALGPARDTCAAVAVRPWHGRQLRARSAA